METPLGQKETEMILENATTATGSSEVTLCEPTCSIGMRRSEWIGDKQNGVELRYDGDFLDEALLYVNGVCVMHMENTSDVGYWFGLYPPGIDGQVNLNVFSKNLRSHIEASAEQE